MTIQYTAKNINIINNVVEKKTYKTIFLGIKLPTKKYVIQSSLSMEIEPSVKDYLKIGDILVDAHGCKYHVFSTKENSVYLSSVDKIEGKMTLDTKGELCVIFKLHAEGYYTTQTT